MFIRYIAPGSTLINSLKSILNSFHSERFTSFNDFKFIRLLKTFLDTRCIWYVPDKLFTCRNWPILSVNTLVMVTTTEFTFTDLNGNNNPLFVLGKIDPLPINSSAGLMA